MTPVGDTQVRRSAGGRLVVNPLGAVMPSCGSLPTHLIDRRSVRAVWVVLSLWAVAWALLQSVGRLYSWHYFVTGGVALLQPGAAGSGLHVYAAHPELQMGPLTLVVAAFIVGISGPFNVFLAALAMTALGALTLKFLLTLRATLRGAPISPRTACYTGLLLIPAWSVLSVYYGHLDDALALTLTTVSQGRRCATATLAPVDRVNASASSRWP